MMRHHNGLLTAFNNDGINIIVTLRQKQIIVTKVTMLRVVEYIGFAGGLPRAGRPELPALISHIEMRAGMLEEDGIKAFTMRPTMLVLFDLVIGNVKFQILVSQKITFIQNVRIRRNLFEADQMRFAELGDGPPGQCAVKIKVLDSFIGNAENAFNTVEIIIKCCQQIITQAAAQFMGPGNPRPFLNGQIGNDWTFAKLELLNEEIHGHNPLAVAGKADN